MKMNKKFKLLISVTLCLVTLFLSVGCSADNFSQSSTYNNGADFSPKGTLYVYSDSTYYSALSGIFNTLSMDYPDLNFDFTSVTDNADIIISDLISPDLYTEFLPLNSEIEGFSDIFPEELTLIDGENILGLPLFLRLDGFWSDNLIYQRNEAEAPISLDNLINSPLKEKYPPIAVGQSTDTLFWSVIAPVYISFGGTAEEIESCSFNDEIMKKSLEKLRKLREENLLYITDSPSELFTKTSVLFWATDISSVKNIKNNMSGLSEISLNTSLIFTDNESTCVVLRADVLAIRKSTDKNIAEILIKELFDEKNLVSLSTSLKMPLACKFSYGSHSVPEFTGTVYSALASPTLEICNLVCHWDENQKNTVYKTLNEFINGKITIDEAVTLMSRE